MANLLLGRTLLFLFSISSWELVKDYQLQKFYLRLFLSHHYMSVFKYEQKVNNTCKTQAQRNRENPFRAFIIYKSRALGNLQGLNQHKPITDLLFWWKTLRAGILSLTFERTGMHSGLGENKFKKKTARLNDNETQQFNMFMHDSNMLAVSHREQSHST